MSAPTVLIVFAVPALLAVPGAVAVFDMEYDGGVGIALILGRVNASRVGGR